VSDAQFSSGYRWERLSKSHPRKAFASGQDEVDGWLKTKALQHQEKHLSATKILLNDSGAIVGYYTLATGQIDFGDLPSEVAKKLPRRMLPATMLAWLGVARAYQGQGLGRTGGFTDCWDVEDVHSSVFQARRADISNAGGVTVC
jgi:hypothetical protein